MAPVPLSIQVRIVFRLIFHCLIHRLLQVRPQHSTAAKMVADGVDTAEPITEHVVQPEEFDGKNLVSVAKEGPELLKDEEEKQKTC